MKDEELFLKHMKKWGLRSKEPKVEAQEKENSDHEQFLRALSDLSFPKNQSVKDPVNPKKIKLAKNKPIAVEEIIDLHGMNKEQARIALNAFIKTQVSDNARTVLIITGKGKNSAKGGVLKPFFEQWVRGEGKPYVRSWAIAPRSLGGEGAFVLYLGA